MIILTLWLYITLLYYIMIILYILYILIILTLLLLHFLIHLNNICICCRSDFDRLETDRCSDSFAQSEINHKVYCEISDFSNCQLNLFSRSLYRPDTSPPSKLLAARQWQGEAASAKLVTLCSACLDWTGKRSLRFSPMLVIWHRLRSQPAGTVDGLTVITEHNDFPELPIPRLSVSPKASVARALA